jgi:hypothetical protein
MAYDIATIGPGRFQDLKEEPEELNPLLRPRSFTADYLQQYAENPYGSLTPEILPALPPENRWEQGLESLPPEAEDIGKQGLETLPDDAEPVHWYDNKKRFEVDSKKYDTKLSPEQEQQFQDWVKFRKPKASEENYDLRGAWMESLQPDENGNLPDKYTKPNHPFFTENSKYAQGNDKQLAGKWDEKGNFIEPEEPTPGYMTELASHAGRGLTTAVGQTVRGAYQFIQRMTDSGRNPYLWASKEDASKDVDRLQGELEAQKSHLQDLGARRDLSPQEMTNRASEAYDLQEKLRRTETLLDWAKEASVGMASQGLVGDISEHNQHEAEVIKDWQRTAERWWGKDITEARNSDFAMQLTEGLFQSAPSIAISTIPYVGPVFGLGAMFTQTVASTMDDLERQAKEKNIPFDEDTALHQSVAQASGQTPWELAGDVLVGRKIRQAFELAILKKDKSAVGNWIKHSLIGIAESTGGEALVTTPGQYITQEAIGEAYGADPKSAWDYWSGMGDQMMMAGAQSIVMGGAPMFGAAIYHQSRGDFRRAQIALNLSIAAKEQIPSVFADAPEQRAEALSRAAAAVPAYAQDRADILHQAAAAVPALGREQALKQAAVAAGQLGETQAATRSTLLSQAATQAPSLLAGEGQQREGLLNQAAAGADPEAQQTQAERNRILLQEAARQAPDLFRGIELPPGVTIESRDREMPPPPPSPAAHVAAVNARLDSVNAQIAANPADPALAREKVILEGKMQAARDAALAKTTADRARTAGAPKTAEALEASTESYVTTRDEAVHDAVDASSDLFAGEEGEAIPPAEPRRGEAGFAPPTTGEVIGAKPPPLPEATTKAPVAPAPEVAPEDEVVVRPGIKSQEAVVQRPSAEIRQQLAGQQVDVEVVSSNGEKKVVQQDASQALMDLKKDRTAFELLSDCIL